MQVDYAEIERLGDEIAELSAHLEAATARLLDRIREFDERGGWNNGFRSCAEWLSYRVGLDRGAAREKVRVARALANLPLLHAALARGEISYAKARALTRVATPDNEDACSSSRVRARRTTWSKWCKAGAASIAGPSSTRHSASTCTARSRCIRTTTAP